MNNGGLRKLKKSAGHIKFLYAAESEQNTDSVCMYAAQTSQECYNVHGFKVYLFSTRQKGSVI